MALFPSPDEHIRPGQSETRLLVYLSKVIPVEAGRPLTGATAEPVGSRCMGSNHPHSPAIRRGGRRKRYVAGLLMIGAIAFTGTAAAADAPACSTSEQLVTDLHREWIMVGCEKRPGDGPFDFHAKLGKFYDFTSPDVVLYDDFDPQHRVARSADEYGTFWTAPFSAMTSARHRVMDGPDTLVRNGLATSTLEFAARLEAADGAITGIRTRSSLVWQCTAQGWRIVREHNSTRLIERGEIDSLIPG